MSGAVHTPGPWVVGPVDDTVVTHVGVNGVRYEVASVDGDYNEPDEWPVMEANARLIAAAPELLAVAQMVVEASDLAGFSGPLGEAARAAIAKAKGGTQ